MSSVDNKEWELSTPDIYLGNDFIQHHDLVEYIKALEDYYTGGDSFFTVQAAKDSLNKLREKYL